MTLEEYYNKYEYLAKKYAFQVFSYEQLSFEFEDLVQEFRLKIFTSIKSYGRRWGAYRRGEASRPVHMKYYLEAACGNKKRDFIKYISRENYKVRMDEINFDFGVENDTQIDPNENSFIVNGIDLLEGLVGRERSVFSLYLRGYNKRFLDKVYYNNAKDKENRQAVIDNDDEPITADDIIQAQCKFLIAKYGVELRKARQVFTTYELDNE